MPRMRSGFSPKSFSLLSGVSIFFFPQIHSPKHSLSFSFFMIISFLAFFLTVFPQPETITRAPRFSPRTSPFCATSACVLFAPNRRCFLFFFSGADRSSRKLDLQRRFFFRGPCNVLAPSHLSSCYGPLFPPPSPNHRPPRHLCLRCNVRFFSPHSFPRSFGAPSPLDHPCHCLCPFRRSSEFAHPFLLPLCCCGSPFFMRLLFAHGPPSDPDFSPLLPILDRAQRSEPQRLFAGEVSIAPPWLLPFNSRPLHSL